MSADAYAHWTQEKISLPRSPPPPPPTAATNAQSPRTAQPPSSAWQAPCVYIYLLGEGGDIGERWHNANMEPAKYLCLHNTRGETGQASCCKKMLHSHRGVARNACLNVFFLIEKKGWKVAAVIDSVSIQSPGYNGGRALERSWSVRWWSISTVAVASLTHVATLVRIQKGANAGMDKYRAEQCSNNTSKNVVQNSCNLFL